MLIEKPLAPSYEEALRLKPLVDSLPADSVMMGHVLLFNSDFRCLVRELRESGDRLRFIASDRHRPREFMNPGGDPGFAVSPGLASCHARGHSYQSAHVWRLCLPGWPTPDPPPYL